jgi:hypothetical protein
MAILTLSRELGCGGREIAQGVQATFGYDLLNRDRFLQEVGARGAKWDQWAKELDERSPTVWERFGWSFKAFGALARSIVLEHAVKDNYIVVEHGGNMILKGLQHVFRVRILADQATRLERIVSRESVDYDTAKWLAERTDHERANFLKTLFDEDWSDPANYDAVFNSSIQSTDEILASICQTLLSKDKSKTKEAQEWLEIHSSAAKLEAGLCTYPFLFVSTLEVVVEDGALVMKGIVRDPKHKKKVEALAKKPAGHNPVRFDLHYRLG